MASLVGLRLQVGMPSSSQSKVIRNGPCFVSDFLFSLIILPGMAMFKLDSKHWRHKPEDVLVLFSWRAHSGVKEVFLQEFMFFYFKRSTCACDPHHHNPFIF